MVDLGVEAHYFHKNNKSCVNIHDLPPLLGLVDETCPIKFHFPPRQSRADMAAIMQSVIPFHPLVRGFLFDARVICG